MVKVSIKVQNGVSRLRVAVQAENIRRAVSIAGRLYPGGDVGVKFPINAESFIVKDSCARAELINFEMLEKMAV